MSNKDTEVERFKLSNSIMDRLYILYFNQLDMRSKLLENQDNISHTVDSVLDHIQTLMKKLDKPVVINSPITIKSEDSKDINKHLYDIAKKVERRQNSNVVSQEVIDKHMKRFEIASRTISKEEFIKRLQELDWGKIEEDVMSLNEEKKEYKVDKLDLVIERLDKLIELLSPVTSQNETDKPIYDFEVRSIFIDDTESKKEIREKVLRESKRLEEEEKNINNPTRDVYKKNLKTNDYIRVGYVDSDYNLEFYGYSERTKAFVPNVYAADWYVMEASMSTDGYLYPVYSPILPIYSIKVKQFGKSGGVLGFKDKYDRDIYYDYFIQ